MSDQNNEMVILNCIKCDGRVRVPIDASPDTEVSCHKCNERYLVGDLTTRIKVAASSIQPNDPTLDLLAKTEWNTKCIAQDIAWLKSFVKTWVYIFVACGIGLGACIAVPFIILVLIVGAAN